MGEHPPLPVCQALNDQRHLSLSVDLRLTFSGAKADIDQITVNARDFMSARPNSESTDYFVLLCDGVAPSGVQPGPARSLAAASW